mgnify:CR=1 FL=1
MIIIIGLGNPGRKFEETRHNVGFLVLDKFRKKNNFPDFKFSKKSNSLLSENILNNEKIILIKPQTFMNESGEAVKKIVKPYTLNPKPLIIIVHDDIDLPVGKIKIVGERGSAGHKGVESIIKNIGNKGLVRIRIGIAPQSLAMPDLAKQDKTKAEKVVLKKFGKKEKEIINNTNNKTVKALDFLLQNGLDKTMNEYNR